jgi:hypothetical protein
LPSLESNFNLFPCVKYMSAHGLSVKWIVQNNNLTPAAGVGHGSMYVTKTGDIYASSSGNSFPTNTRNQTGTVITSAPGDVFHQKWDTNGNRIWSRTSTLINSGGSDSIFDIAADEDGNLYAVQYMQGVPATITGGGGRDYAVYKITSGTETTFSREWAVSSPISTAVDEFSGSGRGAFDPVSRATYLVLESSGTSSWAGGGIVAQGGNWKDLIIGKISTTGTVEWVVQNQTINTTSHDFIGPCWVGADGHLVIGHGANGAWAGGVGSSWMMKINGTNGSLIWKNKTVLANATAGNVVAVRTDLDNNIYVCLVTASAMTGTTAVGGNDIVIVKLDPAGTRLWSARPASINTTSNESSATIDVDTSGNVYLAYLSLGTVTGQPKPGDADITIAKITTAGVVEWVWTPTEINTAGAETLNAIRLDKFRNVYLFLSTVAPHLAGAVLSNTAVRHNALVKLGPAAQISYDPADQIPPTPLLTNVTVSAPAVTEDTIPNGFSVQSVLTSLGANLISPGMNTGIAIYAADSTNGQWHYSINNGGLWTLFPAISESAYLLLNGTNTIIRYTPAANSTASSSISYRAWSGQASWNEQIFAAGDLTSITFGADTPFSEGTATTTLAVTPVNDAPTMNSATYVLPNLSTLNTDTGVDLLTIMNNFTIADVDQSVADITQLGIAIITADTTLGDWEYTEDNGTTWLPLGAVSMTSAVHFNIADTTLIRFAPTTTTSVGSTSITFVGWDKSNAGSLVNKRANATVRGGANPYSSSVGTLSRAIIAPPTVPRSIKASIGDGSITFNWTEPLFFGYTGPMTYKIYDAADNLLDTVSGTTATITTDTTVANFQFKISAYNGVLEGATSTTISYLGSATQNDIERSHMEFDLSWSAPYTQGPTSVITYDIINADTNALMQSNITDLFTSINQGLIGGQTYNIKVRAKMNGIVADSNIKTAQVAFIPTPAPEPVQLGVEQLTIAWNNASTLVQGATFLGYKIYYRKDGAAEYVTSLIDESTTTVSGLQGTFSSLTINATSALFAGLTNGDLYKFRIVGVADIDGVITNGPSSTIIRGIPVAPTVVVSNLSSSIVSSVLDSDTSLAVSAVAALNTSAQGATKVIDSFKELSAGTTQQNAAAGTVFVGLPTASAKSILESMIQTETATAKANLLGQAVQANASQVGSVITSLDSLDERKTAVVAAVQAAIQASSASVLGAALSSGIITSTEVRQAVGASDIANRISVSTIKTDLTTVVTSFTASMTEVKASSDTAKVEIISGAVDQIMRTGAEVLNNVSSTPAEKAAVKVNAITAILKEANATDIDTAVKNTFVAAVKTNFPGEVIELPAAAKTALLNSIPAGRIDTSLIDTTKSLSVVVPNGTEIQLSKVLPNQFVAMELDVEYTFKHKDNLSDTPIVATYKQNQAGARYLEKADTTIIPLGGRVVMWNHPFFLAAAADPLIVPATAPPAPTNVVATRTGGTLNIAFTQPGDGGDAITSYQYSVNGGTVFSTSSITWVSGQSTLTIADLPRGQTYSVILRAVNGVGPGAASVGSNLILIPTIPNSPTNVVATRGNAQAVVTFTPPVNNGGATITSYTVRAVGTSISVTTTITTAVVVGLTNGTSYTFKVVATNEVGNSAESITSNSVIPTTAPTTPTNLVATASNDSVYIEFTQTNINNITGYEYSIDGGLTFTNTNLVWISGQSSVTITKLLRGASYTFYLRSVNWVGNSAPSMSVDALISTFISNPVEVNFNVEIDGNSNINVFGFAEQPVSNVIVAECKLPVDALYDETNTEGLIELWEPAADPNNIYARLASSVKEGVDLTDSFKITAKKLAKGIQKILCDNFDCKLATPFNDSKYTNKAYYTTQRDFGRVALGVFAHYMFGHIDATSAISNDVLFIKNMLSISSNEAATKEINGALDRYNAYTKVNYIDTTDVVNWPETGTAVDANLAIRLVRKIVGKGLDANSELVTSDVNTGIPNSLAYIVKQVVGQDATRLMNVDNNERTKDKVQLLRFYPNDVIYLNIKLAKPSVTVGVGQKIAGAAFADSYTTEQSYTIKITLE